MYERYKRSDVRTHFDLFSFAKSYLRVGQVGVGVHQALSDYIDFFQVHLLWDKSLWRSDSSHQLAPLFYFRWWQRVNLTIGIHQTFSDLSRSWKLKLIGSQSRYTLPALSKAWNEIVHISVLLFHCLDYPPQIRPGKTGPEKVSGQARQNRPWKSRKRFCQCFGRAELTSMRCELCPPPGPLPPSPVRGEDGFKSKQNL